MTPRPGPFVDAYEWSIWLLCFRGSCYPANKGISAGPQNCCYSPSSRSPPVILPVDAVIFAVTAKPAVANQQKALKIRQKFCVNRMDFGSTSGERQISARDPGPNMADAVSGGGVDYVQKCCTLCIQGRARFYGSPVNGSSLRQRQWFARSFATRKATATAS